MSSTAALGAPIYPTPKYGCDCVPWYARRYVIESTAARGSAKAPGRPRPDKPRYRDSVGPSVRHRRPALPAGARRLAYFAPQATVSPEIPVCVAVAGYANDADSGSCKGKHFPLHRRAQVASKDTPSTNRGRGDVCQRFVRQLVSLHRGACPGVSAAFSAPAVASELRASEQ